MTTAEAIAALIAAEDRSAAAGQALRIGRSHYERSKSDRNYRALVAADAEFDCALAGVDPARRAVEIAQEAEAIAATVAAEAAADAQPTLF